MFCANLNRTLVIGQGEFSYCSLLVSGRGCWFALTVIAMGMVGCSGAPSALLPPDLDPEAAAEQAIALYDKDGDGALSLDELEACPGILASLEVYDQDDNEKISQEEIAQRLEKYVDQGVTLARLSARVSLDNKPLGEATVRFIPESYLGEGIKTASGLTRKGGSASMAVADEELPENQKGIRGIHPGTYRVEITHSTIKVPAKFNTSTTLGYETTPGNPYAMFKLQSR
jgi:hypothetical protein